MYWMWSTKGINGSFWIETDEESSELVSAYGSCGMGLQIGHSLEKEPSKRPC